MLGASVMQDHAGPTLPDFDPCTPIGVVCSQFVQWCFALEVHIQVLLVVRQCKQTPPGGERTCQMVGCDMLCCRAVKVTLLDTDCIAAAYYIHPGQCPGSTAHMHSLMSQCASVLPSMGVMPAGELYSGKG